MNKENQIDIELIKKFFNKTCTVSEQETVISWFVDTAYEQKLSFIIKKHWDELDYEHAELDEATEKILNKIHHQINLEAYDEQNKKAFLKKAVSFYSKIAAILLLPILLYTVYAYNQSGRVSFGLLPNQTDAFAEIVSPPGARTHFTLPDGSSGWLNSASTLKFPVKFSGNERNLKLIGEAWFNVVKNPQVPFVVSAMGIDVIAVGTKFNVQAYPDENSVDVTLESGKVIVNRKSKNQTEIIAELKPGEQVSVSRIKQKTKKEDKVDVGNYTAWKDGKLVMRNEKMGELVKKLEKWYNVKITIKDKAIEEYRYRATFQDETIDEIFRLLKLTSPIDYKVKKRELVEGTFKKKEIELFLKK